MKNLHDGLFCGTLVLDNFENRMGVESFFENNWEKVQKNGRDYISSSCSDVMLSINTLKLQTTLCQLEYIASTSALPASTSVPDVSSSSSAVV